MRRVGTWLRIRLRAWIERGTDRVDGRADVLVLRRVNALILIAIIVTAIYTVQNIVFGYYELVALELGALVVMPIARLWALRDPARRVRIAMHLVLAMFTAGLSYTVWLLGPIVTSSFLLGLVILVAAYALGVRAALAWTGVCIAALAIVTLPVDTAILKNGSTDTSVAMFGSRALFLLAIMAVAVAMRVVADRWATEVEASLAAEARAHAQTLAAKERAEAASADAMEARRRLEIAHKKAVAAEHNAEDANMAKSEFLSRVSHELRTPLNAIMGFSELVNRLGNMDERETEWLNGIHEGGKHLLTLIEELLDISRIESGSLDLEIDFVNVNDVIADVAELVRPLAFDKQVNITTDAEGADHWVSADRKRLKQILINLASNAIKYNTSEGSVSISTEANGATVRVVVADTGIGIPADRLEHIFVPFDRLGAERSRVEGTGIGLTIAKSLVEAMGGSLDAVSKSGEGSTFWIEMPRADAPTRARAITPSLSEALPLGSGRASNYVVYIEDDPTNAELVVAMLAGRRDIDVEVFPRARIGIDHLRRRPADLLLLDLHLPDMEPEAILSELREHARTASIPIIVVTADATETTSQELSTAGLARFMTKPIDIDDLMRAINTVLGIGLRDSGPARQV